MPKGERILVGFFVYVVAAIGWYAFAKWAKVPSWQRTLGFIQIALLLLCIAVFLRIRYRFSGTGYGVLLAILACMLILAGLGCLSTMTCGINLGP